MPEPTTARNEALSPAAVRVLEHTRLTHGLHFCLLSPCHCAGPQRGANVPRHASPLSAQLWAEAFMQRGSQQASDQPIYEDVYGEVLALTGSHVLATLSVGRYAGVRQHHALVDALPPKARAVYEAWEPRERGSQAPRPASSPPPEAYAAWLA